MAPTHPSSGAPWFVLSHSLPAFEAGGPTSPQAGNAQGGSAHLGQSHHSPAPPGSGPLPVLSGEDSRRGAGAAAGAAADESNAANMERALANHWGFGLESMESSSLSLSQDCSGGEINSSSRDGSGEEQEVDSAPWNAAARGPSGSCHSSLGSPLRGRGLPPSPERGALLPLSHHSSSPAVPVPRCTSSPQQRVAGSPCAMRRGLSSYFGGKSRSFTSLADVSGIQSIQELAKPVRNYARRKRIAGKDSPKSAEAARKLSLGVGKEPRSLFKKGGGSMSSLGIQAGLAVAVAMGDVDVHRGAGKEQEEGMETVMEEPAEGSIAEFQTRQ